jgi:hypothetical protein
MPIRKLIIAFLFAIAIAIGAAAQNGPVSVSGGPLYFCSNGSAVCAPNNLQIPSGFVFQISTDTGFSRDSAAVVDCGNGTAGNKSCTFQPNIDNAQTGFQIGAAAASGHYLRGNATNYVDSAIQLSDLPTITSAKVDSSVATAAGTFIPWTCFEGMATTTGSTSFCSFTTPAAITVTGFDLWNQTAPVGCTTFAVFELYDGTAAAEIGSYLITLAASTNFYTQVTGSTNVASGHNLHLRITTPASGCSTNATNIESTMTYVMQAN